MASDNTPEGNLELAGERDPTPLYVAVGKAIHAWEGMEQAMARLYLSLCGFPDSPGNLAAFGANHRRFAQRLAATRGANASFFLGKADQAMEGRAAKLFNDVEALAIERHRIAHGQIITFFNLGGIGAGQSVTATALYRWGPAFYSLDNLKVSPFGMTSNELDKRREKFQTAHNQIEALKTDLASL